jgi:hypothetical protein
LRNERKENRTLHRYTMSELACRQDSLSTNTSVRVIPQLLPIRGGIQISNWSIVTREQAHANHQKRVCTNLISISIMYLDNNDIISRFLLYKCPNSQKPHVASAPSLNPDWVYGPPQRIIRTQSIHPFRTRVRLIKFSLPTLAATLSDNK